jgi:hypothetical protein
MRYPLLCAVAVILLGAASANAQLLFGYEPGEAGLPYFGNPAAYTVATTNTVPPVTQGTQAINVSIPAGLQPFGGAQSAMLTDAARVALLNSSPFVQIDMTVPDPRVGTPDFNFGNVDLQFFQPGGTLPGPGSSDETGFSGTFALSDGQTITLTIPLTNTQFGSPHLTLNPALAWAYQIDLSFGRAAGNTGPLTFGFDNLRAIPEPASLLSAGAAVGLMLIRRRRIGC